MSLSYQALGDKLSNTDPINNAVMISGLEFQRDGINLLRAGHYPMACLGSYIHESLHHICFRTPVGSAIATLYHRGFLRAVDHVTLGDASLFDDYHVLEDVGRVETVLHIMRPIAEGMALFGEFDAWPGSSKSLSPVFRNVAIAFAAAVPNWEELQVVDLVRGVLLRGRARPATQRRRENLLMQGFTTRDGGYLPGYFMVKNLQFALFRRIKCDLLLDSEFFLSFLVHWFYGDYRLVAALLDETKEMACFSQKAVNERDSMNAITVAFQRRVSELFRVSADTLRGFDERFADAEERPWWALQMGLPADEARQIEEKLTDEMNAVVNYLEPGSETQQAARAMCHDNMVRRDYLCVGSFDEAIEIAQNGRVKIARSDAAPDFPVMGFGDSEKPGPFSGRAVFDVFQSGLSRKIFFTVYADGERVTLGTLTDDFDEERERLAGVDISTEQCRRAKHIMRATIDEALAPKGSAAVLRDHYRQQWEGAADAMYRNWCGALMTIVGPEANIPAEPGALLDMCDRDARFLRTIAALGCAGSPLLDEQQVENACAANGLTVSQLRARAEALEQAHNLRLIYRLGDFDVLAI